MIYPQAYATRELSKWYPQVYDTREIKKIGGRRLLLGRLSRQSSIGRNTRNTENTESRSQNTESIFMDETPLLIFIWLLFFWAKKNIIPKRKAGKSAESCVTILSILIILRMSKEYILRHPQSWFVLRFIFQ